MKWIYALLATLLLFSCTDNGNELNTGRMTIALTDAPFPTDLVAEANVTITKVEARKSDEENEGSPYVTLMEEEVSIDLLTLTNGVTETLANLQVETGSYDQIRIYIENAGLVLKDGTEISINVPSGAQSGLKLFINPAIEVGQGLSADLLLDFDVSRSFVKRGNNNSYNFKPTIKVANLSTVGRIIGQVTKADEAPIDGAQVQVYAADTLNTTTFTNEMGAYAVLGLAPGQYKMVFEAEGLTPVTEESVLVIKGNLTEVNVAFE